MFSDSICILSSKRSKLIVVHKEPPAMGLKEKLEMQVSLLLAERKTLGLKQMIHLAQILLLLELLKVTLSFSLSSV